MALDEFFSATEMKSGLVTVGRVEELVSAMQKEKDSVVKSIDEKAKWRSSVANALAATESMSVLECFVQLGGVVFLDQWLQEAVQHSNCIGDSSLDDSTCELLRALGKLSLNKAPVFSEILVSVKNLIGHKSSRVQQLAKTLYDTYLDSDKSGEYQDQAKISDAMVDVNDEVTPTAVQPSQHPVEEVSTDLAGGKSSARTSAIIVELNSDNLVGKGGLCISSMSGADHVSPGDKHEMLSAELAVIKDPSVKESGHRVGTTVEDKGLNSQDHGVTGQNDGICSSESHDVSVTGCIPGKMENINIAVLGEAKDVNAFAPDMPKEAGRCEDFATKDGISKPATDVSANELVNSGMDLEVRVAKEVEQELSDCREPLCSSFSQQNPEATVVESGSPDSVNDKQDQPMTELENKMAREQNSTGACISSEEGDDKSMDSSEHKPEDASCQQNLSQVVEPMQVAKDEKSAVGFDLNQDSNSDEMDQVKTLVSSMSAASSSKVSERDLAYQFKGKAVYSESAATAAPFPAASISRSQDAEEALVVEGSSSSKHRKDLMDFDLNIADEVNEATTNAKPDVPESSGHLPSGGSSIEVCSNKPRRFGLDLNSSVDEGDHSSSPVSGSSSVQPPMRNLDLNDNPPVLHETRLYRPDHGALSFQDGSNCGGPQADSEYVLLMGRRIPKDREESAPQTKSFLTNQTDVSSQARHFLPTEPDVAPQTRSFLSKEPVPVSLMSANYAQTGGAAHAYATLPGYGYGNHHMEPFMSLSSEMYTSSVPPYTVDPRVISARQHTVGSFMLTSPIYPAPPLGISNLGSNSGYNWMGPSQPNHDVSSSLFITGVDNNEQGTSRQPPVIPGQASSLEEQTGPSSQLMRLKRREPENGCDPHQGSSRRQPPWL